MENCFQRDYPLTYTHIDCHGLLRPGALFEIMQDAATQHAELLHISAGDIGALWVLSRLRVQLDRPLRAEETLSLTTWCAGIKGATWLRGFCFQIGGEPVGQAISAWVVLDPVNRRLLRPSAVSASVHYQNAPETDGMPAPGKLCLPEGAFHHTHTVRYADMDVNRHLNNAKIVDIISDALELETCTDTYLRTLQVNYTAESVAGDELALCTGEADGVRTVRALCGDSERFEAAAEFAPLH
ncbi:MAG: hypothetical protein IKM54_05615 [Butyricicoccus sp.]|nr:hypothetical protein [Butyricicoccus sp.]